MHIEKMLEMFNLMEKKFSKLEESMEAFMKQITFMQNQGQTLNNHSQAISRLKMQMSQLLAL